MAINNFFDNTSIDVYFHMKNHYKKLKNAKSTIDNSFPQSFVKVLSNSTPPNTGRSLKNTNFEERSNQTNSQSAGSSNNKRYVCGNSASGTSSTSLNSATLQRRPKTRRNQFECSCKLQNQPRSQSLSSSSRKSTSIELCKPKKKRKVSRKRSTVEANKSSQSTSKMECLYEESESYEESKNKYIAAYQYATSKKDTGRICQSRVEEHEYLQFLLRITEDIIVNNVYANEDIETIFRIHIEANKDRLNRDKMEAHLTRLCKELEIPYQSNVTSTENKECYENFFDHSTHITNEVKLEDCECATTRTLGNELERNIKSSESTEKESLSLFDIQTNVNILANKCSLGRVTECTEPSNSRDTLVDVMPSEISLANVHNLSCLENLVEDNNVKKLSVHSLLLCSTEDKELYKDTDLTEKEKLGCLEEKVIFQKLDNNLENEIIDNTTESEFQNVANIVEEDNNSVIDKSTNINISQGNVVGEVNKNEEILPINLNIEDHSIEKLIESLDTISLQNTENNKIEDLDMKIENIVEANIGTVENLYLEHSEIEISKDLNLKIDDINENYSKVHNCIDNIMDNLSKSIQTSENNVLENLIFQTESIRNNDEVSPALRKSEETQKEYIESNIEPIKDHIRNGVEADNSTNILIKDTPKITNDQFTQIELTHSDKECNTSIQLKEHTISEYILLNGPVYVLKTVLNSPDKLVIYQKTSIEHNISNSELHPEKLYENIPPVQCCDAIPVFEPQCTTNYVPSYCNNDFSKLLNSDYDLMPQRDCNMSNKYHNLLVDATTSISDLNLHRIINNNTDALLLSDRYELHTHNQLEDDGKVESKINQLAGSNILENNSFHFQNELPMDGEYELRSYTLPKEVNDSVKSSSYSLENKTGLHQTPLELDVSLTNYELHSPSTLRNFDVSRDVSESGEIVKPSVCTDEEISQTSTFRSNKEKNSTTSSTNRTNILGKRKLKHPL